MKFKRPRWVFGLTDLFFAMLFVGIALALWRTWPQTPRGPERVLFLNNHIVASLNHTEGQIGPFNHLRRWDLRSGSPLATVSPHTDHWVSIGGDTLALIPAGRPATVDLVDIDSLRRIRRLNVGVAQVFYFAISSDAKTLATSNLATLDLWDCATGKRRASRTGKVAPKMFSNDGTKIVFSMGSGVFVVWDLVSSTEQRIRAPLKADIAGFSDDGRSLAIATSGWPEWGRPPDSVKHELAIWDLSAEPRERWSRSTLTPTENVTFTPDGRSVLLPDGTFWDVATQEPRGALDDTANQFGISAAISPDRRFYALGGHDGSVRVWDAGTRKHVATFPKSDPINFDLLMFGVIPASLSLSIVVRQSQGRRICNQCGKRFHQFLARPQIESCRRCRRKGTPARPRWSCGLAWPAATAFLAVAALALVNGLTIHLEDHSFSIWGWHITHQGLEITTTVAGLTALWLALATAVLWPLRRLRERTRLKTVQRHNGAQLPAG